MVVAVVGVGVVVGKGVVRGVDAGFVDDETVASSPGETDGATTGIGIESVDPEPS